MNNKLGDLLWSRASLPAGTMPPTPKGRKAKAPAAIEWQPVTPGSIVLCLDPAINGCGWAVVEKISRDKLRRIDSGCWNPTKTPDATRFNVLADLVAGVAKKYRCTDCIIELPNWGKPWKMSTDDVRANSRAIGAVEAACWLSGVSCNLVRVRDWKGSNPKEHARLIVKSTFGIMLAENQHNESDALALGVWFCWQGTT